MDQAEFKSVLNKVVEQCFPDESLVFNECGDELVAKVFAERQFCESSKNAGEFAWAEEAEAGLNVGKSFLEVISAALGIYQVWKAIRDKAKVEKDNETRSRLKESLEKAGVSAKKIDKVVEVAMNYVR